jgi:hypothetical protein
MKSYEGKDNMKTNKIINLLHQKYGEMVAIIIYSDGSGRITSKPENPYDDKPEFEFTSLQQLIDHLKTK